MLKCVCSLNCNNLARVCSIGNQNLECAVRPPDVSCDAIPFVATVLTKKIYSS